MSSLILTRFASLFLGYAMPRIKNNKTFRDFQTKWTRDNYSSQVKVMFQAALADAKAFFDFPDELVNVLLDDNVNRNEIFRWIVEGVTVENFDVEKLNLLPYMEGYPRYQDMLEAFFITILNKIHEYKETHWTPEFLQLLNTISLFETKISEGFDKMEISQNHVINKLDETNSILKSVLEPVSFEDLNALIKSGEIKIALERAFERLQGKKTLNVSELMELNAFIGSCYFLNGQEKDSIPFLQIALNICQDDARKYRLNSLICLFENRTDDAFRFAHMAIDTEGVTQKNAEILINILIKQGEHNTALEIIESNPEFDLKELHAYVLINERNFDEAMKLAQSVLAALPEDLSWLLIKAEILSLNLENQISNDQIIVPEEVSKEIIPILNHLEKRQIQNDRINRRIKELKAGLSFRNGCYAEAKVSYEWLYYQCDGEFYSKNFLFCCLCDEDWDQAIQLLSSKIETGNFEIDEIITLGKVYVESGEPESAKLLFEDHAMLVDKQSLSSLQFYFAYIDCLMLCLKHFEIQELIQTLRDQNYFDSGIKALNAYYSTITHDWDNAILDWEQCIYQFTDELFIQAAINLTLAYSNRGTLRDFSSMTDLIVKIPRWIYHDSLLNRYVKGLYELGEHEKIISLFNKVPKNLMLLEVVTTIYFNFEWYELAKCNYMALYQKTHDITYLCRYANCLFRLGSTNECLDILKSIEIKINEKPSLDNYHLMSVTYMNSMYFEKALEYAYKTYLLGKDRPEICRFFFGQFLQLAQHINNPLQIWVQEYENIWKNFSEQFPEEEPLFIQVKALNDDNSIADEFMQTLKSQRESFEQTVQMLKGNKLPPSFMAAFLHKGPYETWIHYSQSPDLDFWISQGNLNEIQNGIVFAKNSKSILCEPYTLLTLRQLNLLDDLKSMYNLYIHQEDFNKLFQEYLNKKVISEQGLTTIAYENGNIVHTENSADQVKSYLIKQEEFIQWININCKKIGNTISKVVKSDEKLDFLDNPINACREHSLTMFVDSYVVRDYAKQHFGVISFNTYEWITMLLEIRKISVEKYFECFGELLVMGYALLPINEKVLLHFLHQNFYLMNDKTNNFFLYLRRDDLDQNYVLNVCSKILKFVWLESMPLFHRHMITDTICNVITFQKNKTEMIGHLLSITEPLFSTLVAHQFNKLKNSINKWLEGQIL